MTVLSREWRERELELAGIAVPLSKAEARKRARKRYREQRGLTVKQHQAMLARIGPTSILRRSSLAMAKKPQRANDGDLSTISGDGKTLDGYAAVFNQTTRIESIFEGEFDERIAPGAFAASIARSTPQLQYDHGMDVRMGSLPIGNITEIREDTRGLRVKARLFDAAEPVREAIAKGGLRGMSFRFRVTDETWEKGSGKNPDLRTIKGVELFELGPVTWPAYGGTSVGVRRR